MRVLTVNVGSSSIKLRLVEGGRSVASADVASGQAGDLDDVIGEAILEWDRPDAVAHRIVHGGTRFRAPALLDDAAIGGIEELAPLAPLHQRRGLEGVSLLRRLLPDTPHVGCFDTAFFAALPERSSTYAVPPEWRERYGLRRFGFHGLSHAYASRTAASLLSDGSSRRVVTCHLGSGASLAAVEDGRPVDTTMGFTPLEGIVMATRSGSVDPGMLLWLQTHAGLDAAEVSDGLEHRSGLRGLAGTPDMREILERSASGDEEAALAFDVYVHRLRCAIASMTAAMGGWDALVFTGGVGENAPEVRASACRGLAHLGVDVDEKVNAAAVPDARLDTGASAVEVFVVSSREDLEMAAQAGQVVAIRR